MAKIVVKYCFFSILMLLVTVASAQRKREIFRGGMLLHTGFVQNNLDHPSISGMVTGIGGKMVFRFGDHLRVGNEGYVSSFNYKENDGRYQLGWGGLLTEYQFTDNKITPVVGLTIGGGKVHDLYMDAGNFTDNEYDKGIYKVYSVFVLAPQLSVEYMVSSHIKLLMKVDYLLFPGLDYPDYIAKGPRFYFGVLFGR